MNGTKVWCLLLATQWVRVGFRTYQETVLLATCDGVHEMLLRCSLQTLVSAKILQAPERSASG